jgi:NTE family protein
MTAMPSTRMSTRKPTRAGATATRASAPKRSAQTQPRRDQSPDTAARLPLDLALQGGGSHGAYTWGVLDRLLQKERLEIAGISGTSAGAMNAVALAAGLMEGGREGARTALKRFWTRVGQGSPFSAVPHDVLGAWGNWLGPGNPFMAPMHAWTAWMGQQFSPYQSNPLNLNPCGTSCSRRWTSNVCAAATRPACSSPPRRSAPAGCASSARPN